ncbi:MAG: nitroreductase [Burkholderiaceae bacterium]|nr:nitroreductase [Burkholderiaceae bacterium]MDO9088684.1 nitroreductase [Burkholderiaceae bacterium]
MTDSSGVDDVVAAVDGVIRSRHSVRAFVPRPVPLSQVREILEVAAYAPSGGNVQPWKVHVLVGAAKERLSSALCALHDDPVRAALLREDPPYHAPEWFEPYRSRRRRLGWALYGLLGIERGERERMHSQHARNYSFFDAPIGLIFTVDRRFQRGAWLECGMFLQNVMLAARARGLDTCAQAAFNQFHTIIAEHLSLPSEEAVVCGMSLGHADPGRIENTLRSERVPVDDFVHVHTGPDESVA